jgi:hypothetical protein
MVFYRISISLAPKGGCRHLCGRPAGQRFTGKLTIRRLVFTENFCRLALLLAATRSYVVPDKNVRPFLDRKLTVPCVK